MSALDDKVFSSENEVSGFALKELKATVPWMKVVAILGLILSSAFLILGFYLASSRYGSIGSIAIFYSILALVFGFLFFFLLQYASQLGSYVRSPEPHLLENALEKQKTFWIIASIIMILFTVIMLIAIYQMAITFRAINDSPF